MRFKLRLAATAVPLIFLVSSCVNANGQDDSYIGYIFHPNQ